MRVYDERTEIESEGKSLRLDPAHAASDRHAGRPLLARRRVRQVLTGSSRRERNASAGHASPALCRLWNEHEAQTPAATDARLVARFRNNFCTLEHLAHDPILWHADGSGLLDELRETLSITESALVQFEAIDAAPPRPVSAGIVALADVVEERVDHLFDRMERLTALRQRVFRLSALLEGVRVGLVPRLDDVQALAQEVIQDVSRHDCLTMVRPEQADVALHVAAHSLNVARLVALLASTDSAWRQECLLAVTAALVADSGMVFVPPEIVYSAEPLTTPQWTLIQQHPGTSASVVEQMNACDERLIVAVVQHHERLDGSGYPDGRAYEEISSLARLLAVADTCVGMQSPRPYRPALSVDQAISEIERAAAEGRLDAAWAKRLPKDPPAWFTISSRPVPPSSAPALSALAA